MSEYPYSCCKFFYPSNSNPDSVAFVCRFIILTPDTEWYDCNNIALYAVDVDGERVVLNRWTTFDVNTLLDGWDHVTIENFQTQEQVDNARARLNAVLQWMEQSHILFTQEVFENVFMNILGNVDS
jgi:hypothetical protein